MREVFKMDSCHNGSFLIDTGVCVCVCGGGGGWGGGGGLWGGPQIPNPKLFDPSNPF